MLENFPITRKWPAADPSVIQLYSVPTPNGIKVSTMLEETGLAYEPHYVRFAEKDQFSPEFLSLNPNNKIPAIIDPDGPGGQPMGLFETGAILIYLAEKTGKFLPEDPALRYQTLQWLMFQMGGVGPMFGQFGHFHVAEGKDIADKYALNRYKAETERLLGVLDKHLAGREYLVGDSYTIADIATWPWLRTLDVHYHADELLGLEGYENLMRWFDEVSTRPASLKAVTIPART